MASRIAASLILSLGLPELVVRTLQDYEELAVLLATRADLLARVSQLFSYGLYSHCLYSYGLYSHGLYSHGIIYSRPYICRP